MGIEADFAKTVGANFSAYDSDGSGSLNRRELLESETNERLSQEAREAAHTLSMHFDDAKNMAGPVQKVDVGSRGSWAIHNIFADANDNVISKRDVAVMKLASQEPAETEAMIAKQNAAEIAYGSKVTAGGVLAVALGVTLTGVGVIGAGTPAVLALIPGIPMTLAGGLAISEGYPNIAHQSGDFIRAELADRKSTMRSWLTA